MIHGSKPVHIGFLDILEFQNVIHYLLVIKMTSNLIFEEIYCIILISDEKNDQYTRLT